MFLLFTRFESKMAKNNTFHPKLIIVDHFDDIKNQIDLQIESLLDQKTKDKSLSDEESNVLNKLRQSQLYMIDKVQEKNLSHLKYDEDEFKTKWNHVISNVVLTFEEKIELLKEELITNDCILIEDKAYTSGISVWVTRWFFNRKSLEFLRYVYFFC